MHASTVIYFVVTAGLDPAAHQKKGLSLRADVRATVGRLKGGHDKFDLSKNYMRLPSP